MLKIKDPKTGTWGSPYLISPPSLNNDLIFISSFYVDETELIYVKAVTIY